MGVSGGSGGAPGPGGSLLGGNRNFDIRVCGDRFHDQLAGILAQHGQVDLVGKSFGVNHSCRDAGYDFSIPAAKAKSGAAIAISQAAFDRVSITPREAASRATLHHAMAYDPVTEETPRFLRRR